jgi:hypothetical protein
MSREQGPRDTGMRPAANAAGRRQRERQEEMTMKEVAA